MLNEYVIRVRSKREPNADAMSSVLSGGEVLSINKDAPVFVDLAWLHERCPAYSRETIRKRLELINKGTRGKCLYDRLEAWELLDTPIKTKRGPKRKY